MKLAHSNIVLYGIVLVVASMIATGCSPAAPENGSDDGATTAAMKPAEPNAEGGAAEGTPTKAGILPGIDADNYPAVDGSTANLPLLTGLYADICGVAYEDAETVMDTRVVINGTEDAWKNLIGGDADLIVAYEATEWTMKEAKDAGIVFDPLGRDGLVFLTGEDNPVDSLAPDQLRGIYSGRIKNWSEVGGADEPITAYQRNEGSGSQTMFEKLVMKGEAMMEAPSIFKPSEMGMMIRSLSEFDGTGDAIGYSVFYYADLMYAAPGLKMLAVGGVAPSAETIANGKYELTNDFYVAVRPGQDADSPAMRIRDYLLSQDGSKFMKSLDYVPLK